MNFYDGLKDSSGIHKIKVTLQCEDFRGSFTHKIGGNVKGMGHLEFDANCEDADDVARWEKEGCEISYEDGYFIVTLENDTGETLEMELDADEFNACIVAVEIVAFKEDPCDN